MEGAQSFCPLYRVDFCGEPEGDSQEEVVGWMSKERAPSVSSPYIEWTRFHVKKMGISLTKESRCIYGFVLVDVLEGPEEHIGVGFDNA